MKTVVKLFYIYLVIYSKDHRPAIGTLLEKLNVVVDNNKVFYEEEDVSVSIEFNEDIEDLLRDLTVCDYMTLTDFEKT